MKLVYKETNEEVKVEDRVQLDCKWYEVIGISRPHKSSSTGRVFLKDVDDNKFQYFPSVIGAEWIEREDKTQTRYLGDGVYASFDGYHIILDLRGQDSSTKIALEPSVMRALTQYSLEIVGESSDANS